MIFARKTELLIRGLVIDAWIGVHHHERGRTQKLRIDAVIEIAAPQSDRLSETVDYDWIKDIIVERAARRHHELVEFFASEIVTEVLENERVLAIEVAIAKPEAMPDAAEFAGARVCASRAR